MSDKSYNPKAERLFQTKQGVTSVPRTQAGVPFKEYFANTDLPRDLDRAVVYKTENGPVLAKPDPEVWSPAHQIRTEQYAERLRSQIEEKGYYAKTLESFAGKLAEQTGSERGEMKAVISKAFKDQTGREPFGYLQDQRSAKGLPTREASGPDCGPNYGSERG